MHHQVIFDPEGFAFDHARAVEEGLYEEMTATLVSPMTDVPLKVTEGFIEAMLDATELGVNVPPGTMQKITLQITYTYDYGKVPS
jgi:hypothetical protein